MNVMPSVDEIFRSKPRIVDSDPKAVRKTRLISDVALQSYKSPPALIDGRFPANGFGVLYAPAGTGKTFEAIDLEMSIATGLDYKGARVLRSGPVIHIGAEGAIPQTGLRVWAWKQVHAIPLDQTTGFNLLPEAVNLLEADDVLRLIDDALVVHPALIVFDTLARCLVGADENSAKDMGIAIAALDRLRTETAAAVLVVHHTGKDGNQERGSSALRGAADTVVALSDDGDCLRLSCDKQRDDVPFDSLRVRLVPVTVGTVTTCVSQLATGPIALDLTRPRQAALDTLLRLYSAMGPVTVAEWFRELPAKTISQRRFYDVVDALVQASVVRAEGRTRKRFRPL